MASPQAEHGYVRISNEILDALMLCNLPAYERRILDCILRMTYGWNRTESSISFTVFNRLTLMSKPHIHRAIKGLIKKKMVSRVWMKEGKRGRYIYQFRKDWTKWTVLPDEATKGLPELATNTNPEYISAVLHPEATAEAQELHDGATKRLPYEVTNELPDEETKRLPGEATYKDSKDRKKMESWSPQEIFDLYLELNKRLPTVLKLTDERRNKSRVRLKNPQFISDFARAVQLSQTIEFDVHGWIPTFDWFIRNNNNSVKVIEGNYGLPMEIKIRPFMKYTKKIETEHSSNCTGIKFKSKSGKEIKLSCSGKLIPVHYLNKENIRIQKRICLTCGNEDSHKEITKEQRKS